MIQKIISNYRITLTAAFFLVFSGLVAWLTMPKEEDPRLQERFGLVSLVYPGATPTDMFRYVASEVEAELAEVDEIESIDTTVRSEVAFVNIQLKGSVSGDGAINQAWDEVKDALAEAYTNFPATAFAPELNRKTQDLESVLLALTGDEPLALFDEARRLREVLLAMPQVARVNYIGSPGEQISVDIEDATLVSLGLRLGDLQNQILGSNSALSSGSLAKGGKRMNLRTNASFRSMAGLQNLPVVLGSGDTVPLSNIASIYREGSYPPAEEMFYNGERSVGLAIITGDGLDLTAYGKLLRDKLNTYTPENPDVLLNYINFQPDYVEARLNNLSASLLAGIAIVAMVLLLSMGARLGGLVSSLVPVISLVSLGIYALGGGVLHQISIAAFVMALGLLIDNVIVITESMQHKIDGGSQAKDAAAATVKEFTVPLMSATLTTVAAFIPMLGAGGTTADFTRAIPTVTILTLIISFFFAVFVTPSMAVFVLRPKVKTGTQPKWINLPAITDFITRTVQTRPRLVAGAAALIVTVSFLSFGLVPKKFFPSADRNQLVLDIELPEGTHLNETKRVARALDRSVNETSGVTGTALFVGRSTPQFYYNLTRKPDSPHLAQMIVTTEDAQAARRLKGELGKAFRHHPVARVILRSLEQGPPVKAPIELRMTADSPGDLRSAAEVAVSILRDIPGTNTVRSELGLGVPNVEYVTDDAKAMRFGLVRNSVALALLGRTRGLYAGEFRALGDPMPIYLKGSAGENTGLAALDDTFVDQNAVHSYLVSDLARRKLTWEPSVLHYRNRARVVRVLAELDPKVSVPDVLASFSSAWQSADRPAGTAFSTGGEAAESSKANAAIVKILPLAIMLLVLALLFEFRSLRRVSIVLATVPLGMAGIFPGLLLSGESFGFLALLGGLALIGIIVNNAILLIGCLDDRLAAGETDITTAIRYAVGTRLRPILLTTVTTIAGLLPLAFSGSTLWPPFAWAIISGLILGTFLTLFVVPSLYSLWFKGRFQSKAGKAALVTLMLLAAPALQAAETKTKDVNETIKLSEVIQSAAGAEQARAAAFSAKAAAAQADTSFRATYFPKLGVSAAHLRRSETLELVTPLGNFHSGNTSYNQAGVEIDQTVFDPAQMFYYIPAARRRADAAQELAGFELESARFYAAETFVAASRLDIQSAATAELVQVYRTQSREAARLYKLGRLTDSDRLKIDLGLNEAEQALKTIRLGQPAVRLALGRAAGRDTALLAAGLRLADTKKLMQLLPKMVSLGKRRDLAAMRLQLGALHKDKDATWLEGLTRVYAKGRFNYTDSGQYAQDNWLELELGARFTPIAGGTRFSRREELSRRIDKLVSQIRDTERSIRIAQTQVLGDLKAELANLAVKRKNLALAGRAAGLEGNRYRRGKGELLNLVSAQLSRVAEASAAKQSELNLVLLYLKLRYLRGEDLQQGLDLIRSQKDSM